MQKLVVFLTSLETAKAVIATAARLADAIHPSDIQVLHLRPDVDPDFMPTEEIYTDERQNKFELKRDELLNNLQHLVANCPFGLSHPLQQRRGSLPQLINVAVASNDLVLVGSPHTDREAQQVLNIALIKNMKTVILVSRNLPPSLCDHIAVAWEDEPPARRALEAITPIAQAARKVTFLIGDEGSHFADPPPETINALEKNGTTCALTHFSLNGRHMGEALLAEAHDAGVDLLVMGAFFHSHLREALLGGATLEILKDLNLPVLLHH